MSNLINSNLLTTLLKNYTIDDFDTKIRVIRGWTKNLQKIKGVNEVELKSSFLKSIFGIVLGYKDMTEAVPWNMRIEASTEIDASKPDGILGFYRNDREVTQVVIELKAPRVSLDKKQKRSGKEYGTPVDQAFSYTSKFDRCPWVIVSNMIEIRLYKVGRSQEYYESFHIEDLEKDFFRFHYLLCKENLIKEDGESSTALLSAKTMNHIQDITVEFYNLYRTSRIQLFEELKECNPTYDEEILLEKTQKFLDRIIFICFCEDLGLLPNNLLYTAIKRGKELFSTRETVIWEEIKGIFMAINKGSERHDISAYDGGLFEYDEILDNLVIRNEFFHVIYDISTYDFNSDLDANILGHIFEQSIADIENLKADIYQDAYHVEKSRRKKEGIYYTPRYITRYIVENTLGKYLGDIREEIGEGELPSIESAKTPQMKNKYYNQHLKFYRDYEARLRRVKVLDPACGSGAFLNQAYDFLLNEYRWIYDQISQLQRSQLQQEEQISLFQLSEYQKSVLQNNLYGVDLNEESVEITKLSLWLKTANKKEPLAYLDQNIKCGNSLIDDSEVAGDKAFHWNKDFSEIMENGGFDVVIGNPPYIFARDHSFTRDEKSYFLNRYNLVAYQINTYILFIECGFNILKKGGYLGYITPNNWLTIGSCSRVREYILKNTGDVCIINLLDGLFSDADVDNSILIAAIKEPNIVMLGECMDGNIDDFIKESPSVFLEEGQSIISISRVKNKRAQGIITKINARSIPLKKIAKVASGLKAYEVGKGIPPQTKEMRDQRVYHSRERKDKTYRPYLEGRDVRRYELNWSGSFLKYGEWLAAPRDSFKFSTPRILVRQIPSPPPYCIQGVFVTDDWVNDINSMIIFDFMEEVHPMYILSLINSRLLSYWFDVTFDKFQRKVFPQFKVKELSLFPIYINNEYVSFFIENAMHIQQGFRKLQTLGGLHFSDLVNTFTSTQISQQVSDLMEEEYYDKIYLGSARRLRELTVAINDTILSIYADKPGRGKYDMLKLEVKDYYRRQYIKLYLENLTHDQLEEINKYNGNILEKLLQIRLPGYEKDHVVRRIVKEWNSHQREIEGFKKRICDIDRRIDERIYELYGLTEGEIGIVEGNSC